MIGIGYNEDGPNIDDLNEVMNKTIMLYSPSKRVANELWDAWENLSDKLRLYSENLDSASDEILLLRDAHKEEFQEYLSSVNKKDKVVTDEELQSFVNTFKSNNLKSLS